MAGWAEERGERWMSRLVWRERVKDGSLGKDTAGRLQRGNGFAFGRWFWSGFQERGWKERGGVAC